MPACPHVRGRMCSRRAVRVRCVHRDTCRKPLVLPYSGSTAATVAFPNDGMFLVSISTSFYVEAKKWRRKKERPQQWYHESTVLFVRMVDGLM